MSDMYKGGWAAEGGLNPLLGLFGLAMSPSLMYSLNCGRLLR